MAKSACSVTVSRLVLLVVVLACTTPAAAPAQSAFDRPPALLVMPYFGLPAAGADPGQALGVHVIYPADTLVRVAGRLALHWDRDGRPGRIGSVDLVGRIVGTDTASVSLTGGWMRWDGRDRAAAGVRLAWPILPPEMAYAAAVLGSFDLRYAAATAHDAFAGDGRIWAELMLVVPLTFDLPSS